MSETTKNSLLRCPSLPCLVKIKINTLLENYQMPINTESLNRELFRLLSKYKPKPLDAEGKVTPIPDEADIFKFEFTKDGKDYGTVYVTLDEDRVLTVYFGDDVANSPDDKTPKLDYDDTWSGLLHQLSAWRMTKGLKGFNTQNKDRVADDMARRNHMRNKDKIAEGYYATGKKSSYSDAVPSVKIVIEHSRVIEEGEQRYRNINRIFLENQAGERYLLDTKKPGIARVYARHIAEGGKVNDDRWSHIGSLCEEYQKMAGFVRATRNGQFNESAQSLVNEGIEHYVSLRESLSRMTGKRGYNSYFESWTPPLMEDGTEENNLNELFVQETLDPRIESVMPILNRIHKKVSESVVDKEMNKLAEWADSLVEEESLTSNNPVGIPEGKGDFSQAIEQLSGWDEVEPYEPGTRQYDFDDDEGGYYAQGTVVQDLKTGQIKIEFKDDGEYGGHEINDTFNSIGDAMNALRNITTRRSKSGKSYSRDSLAAKSLAGPDDVYKTDRAGKIGTLTKSRMGGMKASSQHTMRGGPKGVLPEDEMDESALQAYLGDKKYGREGMNKLRQAGHEHASEKTKQNIRAKFSNKEDPVSEVDTGQYDAAKSTHKGGTTPEQEKEFREKLRQYAKELEQRQKEKGVAEAIRPDVMRHQGDKTIKIVKRAGKPIGEIGIDAEASSGIGSYYVKMYDGSYDAVGFHTAEEALGELKDIIKQTMSEDLDANQKRVGQLGPTGGPAKVGDLVGANENFINTVDQAVVSEEDEMDEGEHTQHAMRGHNPGANEFEHDFEPEDTIGNIHDKISKMLKRLEKPKDKEPNLKDTDLGSTVLESEERPYVCVHAKKGKCEVKASSSYQAAQKAAQKWGLKGTAGIDAHLADVKKDTSSLEESTDELERILTIMNHRR